MDTIDALKKVSDIDKKFTVAALGTLIAYNQVKGESPQLDAILLGIASTFIERAQILEDKLDQEKYQELMLSIKNGNFEEQVSKLSGLSNNDSMMDMLKYLTDDKK